MSSLVARERRLARASSVHHSLYWTLLSDAAHANGGAGFEQNRTGSVLHARYYESNPTRLSESQERITSILAFLRAGVSLYCLCTNDNETLSSHHTRVFTCVFLERFFKEAFPRGASLLKAFTFLSRWLLLMQNIDARIMTYNSTGSFLDNPYPARCARQKLYHTVPFFYCARKPVKILIRRPNAEITCHSRYVRSHAEERENLHFTMDIPRGNGIV